MGGKEKKYDFIGKYCEIIWTKFSWICTNCSDIFFWETCDSMIIGEFRDKRSDC
jgi:hypothetical protein